MLYNPTVTTDSSDHLHLGQLYHDRPLLDFCSLEDLVALYLTAEFNPGPSTHSIKKTTTLPRLSIIILAPSLYSQSLNHINRDISP